MDAKINDTEPIDTEINDIEPMDVKINDTEPMDNKPDDTEPMDAKINDTEPMDIKPNDIDPINAEQSKPARPLLDKVDIADVFKFRNSLSTREKIELKSKIIQQPQTFTFPKTGQLSCKHTWLKNEYLMYSESKDALYCFACVVMGVTT